MCIRDRYQDESYWIHKRHPDCRYQYCYRPLREFDRLDSRARCCCYQLCCCPVQNTQVLCYSGVVIKQRLITDGRVVVAAGVANERLITVGRVVGAVCVVTERQRTASRVVVADCVATECFPI